MRAIAQTRTGSHRAAGGDATPLPADAPVRSGPRFSRADLVRLGTPVLIFAAGRALTLAAAHAARLLNPSKGMLDILSGWDAGWYARLAREGYPTAQPPGVGDPAQSTLAFFPVFPILTRGVRAVTGLSYEAAGIFVNVVLGAGAVVLIWLIAERLTDTRTATRAVTLLSFFPGSFVLGMGYTEGLFLFCAGACLLALMHERWVVAGLAAAVAGATRPTGWLLAVCCAWAAFLAWRETRSWRPLLAPALAPLGFIAFSLYLWSHTGDPLMWRESQRIGWNQGFVSGETISRLWDWVVHPLADLNVLVSAVTIGVVVVGVLVVLRFRWQLGSLLGIYTGGILATALAVSMLNSTPRYVMPAFGAYVWLGRRLSETAYAVLLAVCAGGMAVLMLMSGGTLIYTP